MLEDIAALTDHTPKLLAEVALGLATVAFLVYPIFLSAFVVRSGRAAEACQKQVVTKEISGKLLSKSQAQQDITSPSKISSAVAFMTFILKLITSWMWFAACLVVQDVVFVICGVERPIGDRGTTAERQVQKMWPDGEVILEKHAVPTAGGITLGLHRLRMPGHIPSKAPVLLMHGLFESSIVWFVLGQNSLAFKLLQEGHDVWLGNARGNCYSSGQWGLWGEKAHWAADALAKEDFPAMVRHILAVTGCEKICYVGQSQGGAMALEGLSLHPELSDKMQVVTLLAPALCLRRPSNALVSTIIDSVPMKLYRILYVVIAFIQCILPDCLLLAVGPRLMRSMGWLRGPFDAMAVAAQFRGVPSGGTSDANFQRFLNMFVSGQPHEAFEGAARIECPVCCYLGEEDDVVDARKLVHLMKVLPNLKELHIQEGYAHVDFVWTTDASTSIYGKMISQFQDD